jgi:N-acetylneuraminic acid mutarotase
MSRLGSWLSVLTLLLAWARPLSAQTPLALGDARTDPGAVVQDQRLYVAGGRSWLGTSDAFGAYALKDGSYRTLAPLPRALHRPGLVATSDRVYVVGGYLDGRRNVTDEVWSYDPAADAWSARAPLPRNRGEHAVVALDERLYVLSGRGAQSDRVWAYLPHRDRWEVLPARVPQPRYLAAAAAIAQRIYLIGGRSTGVGDLARVDVFEPRTGTWSRAPDLPAARAGLAVAVIEGALHVTGGEVMSSSEVFGDHWVWKPGQLVWDEIRTVEQARRGQGSASDGARWFLVGGSTGTGLLWSGFTASARIDVLDALGARP